MIIEIWGFRYQITAVKAFLSRKGDGMLQLFLLILIYRPMCCLSFSFFFTWFLAHFGHFTLCRTTVLTCSPHICFVSLFILINRKEFPPNYSFESANFKVLANGGMVTQHHIIKVIWQTCQQTIASLHKQQQTALFWSPPPNIQLR